MIPLVVFFGAGIGGVARYVLGGLVQQAAGATFPWGTVFINVTGSFLLGVLYVLLEGSLASPHWRAFLGIGFCGGYTTFSTFSYETARLVESGDWNRAGLYILLSVVVSLLATFVGFWMAHTILGRG